MPQVTSSPAKIKRLAAGIMIAGALCATGTAAAASDHQHIPEEVTFLTAATEFCDGPRVGHTFGSAVMGNELSPHTYASVLVSLGC